MTLMKAPPLGRKEKKSLRPLTEKEIQQKLYGGYLEDSQSVIEKESEIEWVAPPKIKIVKEKATRTPPALPKKKIAISIPWKKIGRQSLFIVQRTLVLLSVFFKALWSAARFLGSKFNNGWTLGILAVFVLFLAVHGLNSYRTTAMKTAKPKGMAASEKFRRKRVLFPKATKALQPASENQPVRHETVIPSVVPVPPVMNMVKEPPSSPLSAAETAQPYVIQVCTYANQTDANKLVDRMKELHLPAFVQPLVRSNGKAYYLVFLGRFETFQEAQIKLKQFRSQPIAQSFQDSFVPEL